MDVIECNRNRHDDDDDCSLYDDDIVHHRQTKKRNYGVVVSEARVMWSEATSNVDAKCLFGKQQFTMPFSDIRLGVSI